MPSTLRMEAVSSSIQWYLWCHLPGCCSGNALDQWYSTFFVRVPRDIISLQLCTPTVVGVQFKLYIDYNIHLK
jgi:hypothetical protein